jgi:CDP-diacylglycerol pyrophosphatase
MFVRPEQAVGLAEAVMARLERWLAAPILLAWVLVAGCASSTGSLPPPPIHPNGQALWRIIHDQCVPDQREHGDPAPCAIVSLQDGEAHGYVALKDRTGVAQYLLMPTAKITGIEDPAVLAPDALNYFAAAWDERRLVSERLGRPLDRTRMSIAVNSVYGRTQDQLHLHIDCVDAPVAAALRQAAISRADAWTQRTVALKGHAYRVRWLDADQLAQTNPFTLLAQAFPDARRELGAWTLALIGATGPGGAAGFYLLTDRLDPASGDRASAEELQDHTCRDG